MAYQAPIITQIVQEVNRYDFKKQVTKYAGDRKVSKLTCFGLLVAMIYTHLKTNRTLRDIVIGFQAALNSFYHLGLKALKRSTMSDALRNRPAEVYEKFYYTLLASLNRSERRRLGIIPLHLKERRHDSDLVRLNHPCTPSSDKITPRSQHGCL